MAEPRGKAGGTDRKALDELGARIDTARDKLSGPRRIQHTKYNTLTMAWRMVLELVIGVVIGGSIGYAFDWALGTLPLMLIVFGGLGFAAGFKTMFASSKSITRDANAADAVAEGDSLGD